VCNVFDALINDDDDDDDDDDDVDDDDDDDDDCNRNRTTGSPKRGISDISAYDQP